MMCIENVYRTGLADGDRAMKPGSRSHEERSRSQLHSAPISSVLLFMVSVKGPYEMEKLELISA